MRRTFKDKCSADIEQLRAERAKQQEEQMKQRENRKKNQVQVLRTEISKRLKDYGENTAIYLRRRRRKKLAELKQLLIPNSTNTSTRKSLSINLSLCANKQSLPQIKTALSKYKPTSESNDVYKLHDTIVKTRKAKDNFYLLMDNVPTFSVLQKYSKLPILNGAPSNNKFIIGPRKITRLASLQESHNKSLLTNKPTAEHDVEVSESENENLSFDDFNPQEIKQMLAPSKFQTIVASPSVSVEPLTKSHVQYSIPSEYAINPLTNSQSKILKRNTYWESIVKNLHRPKRSLSKQAEIEIRLMKLRKFTKKKFNFSSICKHQAHNN